MFKAIHLIQNLPHDETNPGRFLILEDTETKERTKLPFQKNCLSAVFGNQMFDIYGRELEVDPNITQILNKFGRWVNYNTDAETYFVRTADDKIFVAYISYYYIDGRNSQRRHCEYIQDLNPLFRENIRHKGELILTDFEVVNSDIFREHAKSIDVFRNKKFILTKSNNHYSLRSSSSVLYSIPHSIFKEKTDECPTWVHGNYFLSCSCKDGKILATSEVKTPARPQIISIETDVEFINQHYRDCLEIPFYLAE